MKNTTMKTAWVTGGSSGIGLELTQRLLKDKFQVCIFAHAGIEQAVANLKKISPSVCGFEVDVQNESTMDAKFAEAVATFGTPDLLINSAGISIAKNFDEMTSQEFESQININLVGSRNVAHAALPHLKQAVQQGKRPKIVFIASAAGLVGCYGYTGYCASKFGVIGLAEVLRMELRSQKIDVAVVCPPEVDTPLVTEERKTGSPVTAALKQLGGGTMPVDKACKEIYEGIFANEFMIIVGTQLRILTKLSRILPDTYRGQIDKKLDQIIKKFAS
ncbi:SDR family NAD(P)-dependent oxidoreductase [Acinetobacter sp. PK01]|uniref:SDR family NAD(P)-dependent oxidoreductase n=1 Tax=Acinetobacter sp. PK01 TaxID=2930198 RepID=UPI001FB85018|nr:SDR family NAD(P)-dependent oxidoreductase [Acinetobacter sp. PK01]UOG19514.1 SDR family NAD(P)-dependent oxidoreductase [Acinetobacter sp. PK01]